MERADWPCRKESHALPAILTAAGNARTVAAWAVLMRRAILPPLLQIDDLRFTIDDWKQTQ
jgi:hypothetical protein